MNIVFLLAHFWYLPSYYTYTTDGAFVPASAVSSTSPSYILFPPVPSRTILSPNYGSTSTSTNRTSLVHVLILLCAFECSLNHQTLIPNEALPAVELVEVVDIPPQPCLPRYAYLHTLACV